jgi:hypothetical protein
VLYIKDRGIADAMLAAAAENLDNEAIQDLADQVFSTLSVSPGSHASTWCRGHWDDREHRASCRRFVAGGHGGLGAHVVGRSGMMARLRR